MMTRSWMVLVVVAGCGSPPPPAGTNQVATGSAAAGSAAPPAPSCVRMRATSHPGCHGDDRGDDNTEAVTVCDGCVANADCTARAGGTCASAGGGMCSAPAAFVCRYPNDVCEGCVGCSNDGKGNPVCTKGQPANPPATEDGG